MKGFDDVFVDQGLSGSVRVEWEDLVLRIHSSRKFIVKIEKEGRKNAN